MSTKILMPALSPTMKEGNLQKWLVKIGDKVNAGDIIAEIETDKATMEVEAVDEGVITQILVNEGTKSVSVNSTIAILDGNENSTHNKVLEIKNENKKEVDKNQDIETKEKFNNIIEKKSINKNNSNIIASPYAKKLAKEKNIKLESIKGSGPGGRIIKRDFERTEFQDTSLISSLHESIEVSPMRKIIAEKTTQTIKTVPHFYLTIESHVDKLLKLRKKINKENSEHKISINDILVKALAIAQSYNPKTNVSWSNGKIIKYSSIDVSIAVALEEGLITPIIKNADSKGLLEISKEIDNLLLKAKSGKLTPDEYNGGTISISNLGMFGISEFKAIINHPQSSILAVGAIKKKPIIEGQKIIIGNTLKSTLSADHRVLDGAVAAKLLKDFSDIIENPYTLWLQSKDMHVI